jgi:hypothetical protein
MKIEEKGYIMSVAQYVDGCTNCTWSDGSWETISEKLNNTSRALGRLCQMLVDRGQMSADELKTVSGGYEDIKFVED